MNPTGFRGGDTPRPSAKSRDTEGGASTPRHQRDANGVAESHGSDPWLGVLINRGDLSSELNRFAMMNRNWPTTLVSSVLI